MPPLSTALAEDFGVDFAEHCSVEHVATEVLQELTQQQQQSKLMCAACTAASDILTHQFLKAFQVIEACRSKGKMLHKCAA